MSQQTMSIHWGKHHWSYLNNLNKQVRACRGLQVRACGKQGPGREGGGAWEEGGRAEGLWMWGRGGGGAEGTHGGRRGRRSPTQGRGGGIRPCRGEGAEGTDAGERGGRGAEGTDVGERGRRGQRAPMRGRGGGGGRWNPCGVVCMDVPAQAARLAVPLAGEGPGRRGAGGNVGMLCSMTSTFLLFL